MENENKGSAEQSQGSAQAAKLCCCKVDFKAVFEKAKEVLLNPDSCWTKIKEEQITVTDFYKKYVCIMAAIGPVCSFLGSIRAAGFINSFMMGLVHYAMSLGTLYLFAVIVEKLAPKFNANIDRIGALKLLAYSMTPSYIAGLSGILPGILAFLVSLFGLYSIYIFYKGLSPMTGVSEDKKLPYFITMVAIVIVTSVIIGVIMTMMFVASALTRGAAGMIGGV